MCKDYISYKVFHKVSSLFSRIMIVFVTQNLLLNQHQEFQKPPNTSTLKMVTVKIVETLEIFRRSIRRIPESSIHTFPQLSK